jgi:hypothetical protein
MTLWMQTGSCPLDGEWGERQTERKKEIEGEKEEWGVRGKITDNKE